MIELEPRYIEAVKALANENCLYGAVDGPISKIVFVDNYTPPTEEQIKTKQAELQAEWDSQEYARNRKTEYDALNQFELISDDDVNGTTTHKDAIAAIKTKYPKG